MGILANLTSDRKAVAAIAIIIVALGAAVRFLNIGWSFSADGIDEGIMLERAQMISRGWAPYTSLPLDQAPLGLLIGGAIWGDVVTLRALAASISIVAVIACMEAARRIKGNFAMIITGALLALDFAFLRETRTFSLNGLSSSFTAISILFFVLYIQKRSRAALVLAGLLIGVATSMKFFGVIGFAGMVVFLGLEYVRPTESRRKGIADFVLLSGSAVLPVVALMLYLGPSEMIQGMLFDQGHRGFEPIQKLSFLPYFATNLAYMLPFVNIRKMWSMGAEIRLLLSVTGVLVIFMIAQPLTYYHHLVMLSPALSILSGVFISTVTKLRKGSKRAEIPSPRREKVPTIWGLSEAAVIIGLLISAGLAAYGIAVQREPTQQVVAERIAEITGPNDWIVCGDPTISAYANRPTPPSLVNVAYSRYPDMTSEEVEMGIVDNNVSVVVLAYRLNSMSGLPDFLESHGYSEVSRAYFGYGDGIAIYTFNRAIEPFSFYVRDDIVHNLSLPVA